MKVALIQAPLDSSVRSANIIALGCAIDEVAGSTETPDVLVLPADCDGVCCYADDRCLAGFAVGVRELISEKAREWGVYIAAGLNMTGNGDQLRHAVLIDPDGDVLCTTEFNAPDTPEALRGDMAHIPGLGTLAVSLAREAQGLAASGRLTERALVVVPVGIEQTTKEAAGDIRAAERLLAAGAERYPCYFALVAPAHPSHADAAHHTPPSFLLGPGGEMLVSINGPEYGVVFAELTLTGTGKEVPARTDRG